MGLDEVRLDEVGLDEVGLGDTGVLTWAWVGWVLIKVGGHGWTDIERSVEVFFF